MVRFKINSKLVAFAAVMLLAVSMMVGCSQNPVSNFADITDPNQPPDPRILTRVNNDSGAQLAGSNLYIEQVIPSALGGTLTLFDVTLVVPPLAVNNDTLFSIEIPDPNMFYNKFGTSGLQFNNPVVVTMSYRDADLSGITEMSIRLAWLDEFSGTWRDMPCVVDTVSKTVVGELTHFSSYGLISD